MKSLLVIVLGAFCFSGFGAEPVEIGTHDIVILNYCSSGEAHIDVDRYDSGGNSTRLELAEYKYYTDGNESTAEEKAECLKDYREFRYTLNRAIVGGLTVMLSDEAVSHTGNKEESYCSI